MTHPIGSEARRGGSARSAATVPLSAHCTSSRNTTSGAFMATPSSSDCSSCSCQKRCSGAARSRPNPARSSNGCGPSKSALRSGASSATDSQGSAAPTPAATDARCAIRTPSPITRLFPIPAAPSIRSTAPEPERIRLSRWPTAASSASRPRIVALIACKEATGLHHGSPHSAIGPGPGGPPSPTRKATSSTW